MRARAVPGLVLVSLVFTFSLVVRKTFGQSSTPWSPEALDRAGRRVPVPGSLGQHLGTTCSRYPCGFKSAHRSGPRSKRYGQAEVCRIASASALFSGGGAAENGAMVMSDRPQALFRPRMHTQGFPARFKNC